MEESIHFVFDKAGHISKGNSSNNDDDELGNPLNAPERPHEGNYDVVSLGPKSKTKYDDTTDKQDGGTSQGFPSNHDPPSSKGDDQSPMGDSSMKTDPSSSLPTPLKPRWKHKSSHPLHNLMSPLNSCMQARNRAKNLYDFFAFLSQIDSKIIKEALKNKDWINATQEELH